MRKNLVFGGVNSIDHGVYITGSGTFSAPERDYEAVSVPGRNGDLIIDNGRWRNIEVTYPAFIQSGFDARMSAFRALMCSKTGYQRLEDDYHPDEYRLGVFSNGITPRMRQRNTGGEFDITFNCKPQRFLKSGEMPIQFLPPRVFAGNWYSQYMPVNDTQISIEVHCPSTDEFTVFVETYDDEGTMLYSQQFPGTDGEAQTVALTAQDKFLQIRLEGVDSHDDTWLNVKTTSIYNGEAVNINAIMARTWWLQNPTGFATKPLIEVYADNVPFMTISNRTNGEQTSYYSFRTTDTLDVHHVMMDCDIQYLYDDDKNNLTSHLFLTTLTSYFGQGLVFPELGEDQIRLGMNFSSSAFNADGNIGLVNIYPLWWKL